MDAELQNTKNTNISGWRNVAAHVEDTDLDVNLDDAGVAVLQTKSLVSPHRMSTAPAGCTPPPHALFFICEM